MQTKLYGKMLIARVGRIYSNMSITAAAICVLALFATIVTATLTAVFMMLAVFAVICTLGIILAFYPNLFDSISVGGDRATEIINFLSGSVAPITSVVAVAAGALSLVFLLLGEPEKNKGRITFSAIITLLGAVAAIILFTVGKQ